MKYFLVFFTRYLFDLFIINKSNRENKVGTFVGSDIIDGMFACTTTLEVNSAVSIEGFDVRVSEV